MDEPPTELNLYEIAEPSQSPLSDPMELSEEPEHMVHGFIFDRPIWTVIDAVRWVDQQEFRIHRVSQLMHNITVVVYRDPFDEEELLPSSRHCIVEDISGGILVVKYTD